jgi:DNA-binding transcriptional MerR regulator
MKISELSRETLASPRSIRYYEEMGLIKPARTEAGYRIYNNSHIKTVKEIMWMLEAGLTLKNIKYIVPCTLQKTEILMCADLQELFESEIIQIELKIKALKNSHSLLKRTLKNSILVTD